jgi:hypothetical protein
MLLNPVIANREFAQSPLAARAPAREAKVARLAVMPVNEIVHAAGVDFAGNLAPENRLQHRSQSRFRFLRALAVAL